MLHSAQAQYTVCSLGSYAIWNLGVFAEDKRVGGGYMTQARRCFRVTSLTCQESVAFIVSIEFLSTLNAHNGEVGISVSNAVPGVCGARVAD